MNILQNAKTKLFTLIELIVVIVVLGILAAIVIPNISSFKEEAEKTAIVSDTRNIQTAVDMFMLKNHGATPTIEKPTFDNPQTVQLYGLQPDYLRSIPKSIDTVHFWLDSNNMVHSSYVDAPTGVQYVDGNLTWNGVSGAATYNIYTLLSTEVTAKAKASQMKFVKEIAAQNENTGIQSLSGLDASAEGEFYVSAVDPFGFESVMTSVDSKYTAYTEPDKDFVLTDVKETVNKGIPTKMSLAGNLSYNVDAYTYRIPSVVEVKSTAPRYVSTNNYYLSYLFDGNYTKAGADMLDTNHYWLTSSSGNQFLTFNFFEPKEISHLNVAPRTRHDHHSDYRISVSNDNVQWEEVVSWQEGNAPIGTLRKHEIEGKYQYIRFELTREERWGVSLAEVEVFEYQPYAPEVPEQSELTTSMPLLTSDTSHSSYATVTASSHSDWGGVSYDPYKAFDGITGTTKNGWMANSLAAANLEVNFVSKRAIKDIGLFLGPNINESLEGRAKDFAIQYYDQTTNEWKTALDSSLLLASGEQRFTVPVVGDHNRWRLYLKNHHYSGNAYMGIEEWKIY